MDAKQPLRKLYNTQNPLTRISKLEEQTVIKPTQPLGALGEVTELTGDLIVDRLLLPSTSALDLEPSSTDFTGVFAAGDGVTFSNYNLPMTLGGVTAGIVNAGFDNVGNFIGGGGNVTIGSTGINTASGADISVNQWQAFGLNTDDVVTGGLVFAEYVAGGKIYIGASTSMSLFNGEYTNSYIMEFDLATKRFSPISVASGGQVRVTCMVVDETNGVLYVGASTVNINGIATADYIASYTIGTATWASITTGTPLNGQVRAMALSGGVLYVGGAFTDATGIASADYIAKYTISGGTWASITASSQLNGEVYSIVISNGIMYVGGNFTNAFGDNAADYIVTYNIAGGTWSGIAGALNGIVRNLIVGGDYLFLGGDFTDANGVSTEDYITAYNISTSAWTSLAAGATNAAPGAFGSDGTYIYAGWGNASLNYNKKIKIADLTVTSWFSNVTTGTTFSSVFFDSNGNGYASLSPGSTTAVDGINLNGSGALIRWSKLRDQIIWLSNTVKDVYTDNSSPQGYLANSRIVVSVSSNNLTVKVMDPFSVNLAGTNKGRVRIGNSYYRFTTTQATVTKNAGTNWFNAGAAETAAKAVDYFVYLLFNSNAGAVDIGFSRIPYGQTYADFSATSTSELYFAYGNATAPAATDIVENIGRFTATLSAGAGYTWSSPTGVINKPTYETSWLTWLPTYTGFTSSPTDTGIYKITSNECKVVLDVANTTSNATTFTLTLPIGSTKQMRVPTSFRNNGVNSTTPGMGVFSGSGNVLTLYTDMTTAGAWTNANTKAIKDFNAQYKI